VYGREIVFHPSEAEAAAAKNAKHNMAATKIDTTKALLFMELNSYSLNCLSKLLPNK
jgi:hypothetical protein